MRSGMLSADSLSTADVTLRSGSSSFQEEVDAFAETYPESEQLISLKVAIPIVAPSIYVALWSRVPD